MNKRTKITGMLFSKSEFLLFYIFSKRFIPSFLYYVVESLRNLFEEYLFTFHYLAKYFTSIPCCKVKLLL